MPADPRCPSCDGKVSATAQWCMHCGRDFDAPVDGSEPEAGTSTVTKTIDAALGTDESPSVASGATSTDASAGSGEPADPVGDLLDEVSGRDTNASSRSVGTDLSGAGLLRAGVESVIEYVSVDEDRRQGLVVTVAFLSWLLASSVASSDPVALVGAVGLGLYLYTRSTVRETVAASAYGAGALIAAVPVASVVTGAVPVSAAVAAVTRSAVVGGLLVSLGLWIRGREF